MTDVQRKPIVVGVDGSPNSVRALRLAGRLATAMNAPLKVITVWEPPIEFGWSYGVTMPPYDWRTASLQLADNAIKEAFGTEPPARLTVRPHEGYPAAELIVASRDALMLVVGNRGHGGFASLLLGSVSVKCVEHAHCPVLVVRPDTAVGDSTPTGEEQGPARVPLST